MQAKLLIAGKEAGSFGKLKASYQNRFGIKRECFAGELDFMTLIQSAKAISTYRPLHPFAVIKLDKTIELTGERNYEALKKQAFSSSGLLTRMEVVGMYEDKITIRYYFSSPDRNITEDEAKEELKKV